MRERIKQHDGNKTAIEKRATADATSRAGAAEEEGARSTSRGRIWPFTIHAAKSEKWDTTSEGEGEPLGARR